MGKKAVPQAKPGAMKQPGRERRSGAVEVLALSALRPSPEVLSSCRRTKTCPKKRPVEVIAAGSPGSGRLPRPDETGQPREAMPPLAVRMAKRGEEEHKASYGRCTRRS